MGNHSEIKCLLRPYEGGRHAQEELSATVLLPPCSWTDWVRWSGRSWRRTPWVRWRALILLAILSIQVIFSTKLRSSASLTDPSLP